MTSISVHCVTFVLLILIGWMYASVEGRRGNKVQIKKAATIDRPPMIKMMKRRIRDFEHDKQASITLVFYTTRDTYVRWFWKDEEESERLDGSEIPGFFPIDGDRRYTMRYLVAGGVVAATLNIHRYKPQERDVFETVISTHDGKVQYNLRTTIDNTVEKSRGSVTDDIDSPEWDWIPADQEFEVGSFLEIGCQVFIPDELRKKTQTAFVMSNELRFRHKSFARLAQENSTTFENEILNVHSDSDPMLVRNITERTGNDSKVITGYRKPFRKLGHVLYESKLTTSNATADLEGIYQCVMERWDEQDMSQFEKSYAIGEATIKGHPSPYIDPYGNSVRFYLRPCDKAMLQQRGGGDRLMIMYAGRKACFRWVVISYPRTTKMELRRDSQGVVSHSDITAVESINVANGGMSEMTYIFHDPQPNQNGEYQFRANFSNGFYSKSFKIKVVTTDS